MTKRDIARRIYLTGNWSEGNHGRNLGYIVQTTGWAGSYGIAVTDYRAGCAIVRALRAIAADGPQHLFEERVK
jgi:hypothetical protein